MKHFTAKLSYNSGDKDIHLRGVQFQAPTSEEAAMLNPMMLLTALLLLVFSPSPAPRAVAQDAAAAPAAAQDAKNPVKPTAESQAKAKTLYKIDCAMCHGDNGNGKTDLANDMQLKLLDWGDPKSLAGMTDQQLFNAIRNGKDKMPPEAVGRANDTEVWNLIIYIRKMSQGQAEAPAAPTN